MRDSDDSLYLGYLGNLTTLNDLQQLCGFSLHEAADACLVSPETFRRWRSDREPNPTAVRLLAILAGYVPWPGWQGWEVHRGLLFPPGYRRGGIGPGDIYAMPFERQLLAELKRQLRRRAPTPPSSLASPDPDPVSGAISGTNREAVPVGVAKRAGRPATALREASRAVRGCRPGRYGYLVTRDFCLRARL